MGDMEPKKLLIHNLEVKPIDGLIGVKSDWEGHHNPINPFFFFTLDSYQL